MALNIPNTGPAIDTLLSGINTGSNMFSRLMQPVLDREKLKQQQEQFVQNLALQKQAEDRHQSLMPYLIQQYKDAHERSAAEAQFKQLYRNLIQNALTGEGGDSGVTPAPAPVAPALPPQMGGQPNASPTTAIPDMGGVSMAPNTATVTGTGLLEGQQPPIAPVTPNQNVVGQEHELRSGNPRLANLDRVAGLVPGIPKPQQHITNGMVFTTYPSGRMTVQQVPGISTATAGEKNVSAKEASKIRDQATALVNNANLVQQGYDLLDNNKDLTGIGSGLASKFNLSNNPELGKFTTVTGKLQAELGKYASSRGGIQAVNWASTVKPSAWKPENYNYGMFEGIQQNLKDDYNTLNEQYRAATGRDLPIKLPNMGSSRSAPRKQNTESDKRKVTKWKMTGGQLVKE